MTPNHDQATPADSAPIVELDHDHDDLTVLLRDLHTLVSQAIADEARGRALAEARRLLNYFRADMAEHFQREESLLFPALRQHLPERAQTVDGLARAHQHFEHLVGAIQTSLQDDAANKAALRACLTQIDKLLGLFEGHSLSECELVRAMDARVNDPTTRAHLRATLSSV
jgi:iron-sulfur cluster repair protein YtfE (RIC family)